MSQSKDPMTIPKRKPTTITSEKIEVVEKTEAINSFVDDVKETETLPPTGKIFLGEEDKRLLQKLNKHLVNKLGLGGTRSFKV